MNKLLIISFILGLLTIGSLTPQVTAAPTCPEGFNFVAGLCYGPCASGEQKTQIGWCKKENGKLYLPKTSQAKY